MPGSGLVVDESLLDVRHGSFATDVATEISEAKMQTGRLFLTVKWAKRPASGTGTGIQPQETVFTNSELKRHNPLLLCEFYESMLRVNIKQTTPQGAANDDDDTPTINISAADIEESLAF